MASLTISLFVACVDVVRIWMGMYGSLMGRVDWGCSKLIMGRVRIRGQSRLVLIENRSCNFY